VIIIYFFLAEAHIEKYFFFITITENNGEASLSIHSLILTVLLYVMAINMHTMTISKMNIYGSLQYKY